MKNPYLRIYILSAIFLSVILINQGCKKADTPTILPTAPGISTLDIVLNVTSTTAQSGGTINSTGGIFVTVNGVCYSITNTTPTTADSKTTDSLIISGTATGTFTSKIINLTPSTKYYLRAYATNSLGTSYGKVVTFTTGSTASSVVATVSTLAGNGNAGFADGTGASALFNNPQGVAVDSKGNIYVSDSFNNYIRKITPAGVVTTIAGNGVAGYTDGAAATAQFYAPQGLALDAQGNLYIADLGNNVIRKLTPAGVVSTFAGSGIRGYLDGTAAVAEFNGPHGIAFDAQGNLYVADRTNNSIREISPAGVVSSFAGFKSAGFVDATGVSAQFNNPNGIAVDASGNVYVADQGNSAIRKISPAGAVITQAGGPTQSSILNFPSAIALDSKANIYIADEGGRIFEFTTTNVLYNLAGGFNVAGFVNGTNTTAQFNNPQGIAVDASGNVYIADQYNNSIRKMNVVIVP
jgi:sugar lactone lactonase YvrE